MPGDKVLSASVTLGEANPAFFIAREAEPKGRPTKLGMT